MHQLVLNVANAEAVAVAVATVAADVKAAVVKEKVTAVAIDAKAEMLAVASGISREEVVMKNLAALVALAEDAKVAVKEDVDLNPKSYNNKKSWVFDPGLFVYRQFLC